jgi:Ca2+-transporting ATPase
MQTKPTTTMWHTQTTEQVCAQLAVTPAQGLAHASAAERLLSVGANKLKEKAPRPAWKKFLDQFKSLLIMILIGAALLAGAIGDMTDAIVILVVVLFNASLGFYQEYRAEATLAALKKMLAQRARVRRNGEVHDIAATELVPGDIVLLEAGEHVPADARVLEAHNALVAEAALTGESQAVGKQAEALSSGEHPLAERDNMVFMNTVVTRGRLEIVVVATGMHTEMGRISGLLESAEELPTPLQIQLDGLGKRLALIASVVVALIFVLGLAHGDPLLQTLMTAIALAVAAIPEGLPAVVTVTLAIGMHRMAKQRAIVKKLSAVETLGATSVICSDKTGTLTLNQMSARALFYRQKRYTVSGQGYRGKGEITAATGGELPDFQPLLIPAALCNESRIRDGELIGDPTEGALLALALQGGINPEALVEHSPRIAEIPFDSAHKFMASFHHDGENVRMWLKGAPDVLLARATHYLAEHGEQALDAAAQGEFAAENARLANDAMRVLAVARRDIPAQAFDPSANFGADLMQWAQELTLVGLVGMIDPPRPEAREAIKLCQQAGIQVKMITGDHALTAAAIARELGLQGSVLSGAELDAIDTTELSHRIEDTAVFARVAPEHKVKIIQALKARGHVVAMTGDGVNDAPALKHADIGIAMGITGTAVTQEAASMVLTDDNFATLVGAVKEGRTIYDNIVKFVRFQLSTNIAAILTVLGAQLVGLPMPFTAIQILWINIIMDGPPAMSLGAEPAHSNIMQDTPRSRDARILSMPRLLRLMAYGSIMALGTVGVFAFDLARNGLEHALTMAFTTFVLFQFFNVFNARAEHHSAFNRQFFANRNLWLSLIGVVGLQVLVVHWQPAQSIFHTVDLSLIDWGLATLVASSVLVFDEVRKLVIRLARTIKSTESC